MGNISRKQSVNRKEGDEYEKCIVVLVTLVFLVLIAISRIAKTKRKTEKKGGSIK